MSDERLDTEELDERDMLLLAYADGELDPAREREVEGLIARDPRARRKVEIFWQTAAMLRAAGNERRYAAPAPAPAKVAVLRPPRRAHLGFALAASLAALVVGFGGGTLFNASHGGSEASSERDALIDEIMEYHPVYAAETEHLVEVPASRAGELSAWLGERVGRKLPIPDLADAGLTFAGGRMLVVGGRPVAQLLYTRAAGAPIGICVTRLPGGAAPLQVEQHGDLAAAEWEENGFAYVVVGDLSKDAARDLANRVAATFQG
jgi:anti-sigma factor RsiW